MNFNRAERLVLEEFQRQGRGQTWLTRPMLKHCLYRRDSPYPFSERTLYNVLTRLERWRIVERFPTSDHGEYYVLTANAR